MDMSGFKAWRKMEHLSLVRLATLLEVSFSTVQRWDRNEHQPQPRSEEALRRMGFGVEQQPEEIAQ